MSENSPMIDTLVDDLVERKPVTLLPLKALGWYGFALTCVLPALFILGLGHEVDYYLSGLGALFQGVCLLISGYTVTLMAFRLSIPGLDIGWGLKGAAALSGFGFIAPTLLFHDLPTPFALFAQDSGPIDCMFMIVSLSIAPAFIFAFWVRHQAPINLKRTGYFLMLGAFSIAGLMVHLACPNTVELHYFVWHILPALGLALLGLLTAPLFLRW